MTGVVTHHSDLELVSGDDWVIPFTCLNADGSAFDLTGTTMQWALVDDNGVQVAAVNSAAVVAATAPTNLGNGTITVPHTATDILAGRYTDMLRVVNGSGDIQTEWTGVIDVDASAFE